jgi:hypothetical protein
LPTLVRNLEAPKRLKKGKTIVAIPWIRPKNLVTDLDAPKRLKKANTLVVDFPEPP